MTPEAVVRSLWERFEARDWDGAGEVLARDLRAAWRASGESFTGRDAYLRVNRNYPGDWHAELDEIVVSGDRVVARLTVTLEGVAETCIGFYRVANGEITDLDEWWVATYIAPEWRR